MSAVAFRRHPDRESTADLVSEMQRWLDERGHRSVDDPAEADLVVSVGGDGTMLRAVDEAARHGTPVLGVNVGQLGYLTEVDPEHWRVALELWEDGRATIVDRMLLSLRVVRTAGAPDLVPPVDGPQPTADGSFLALNEVVLEKTPTGRMVRLGVVLDDQPFTTYAADGMIVATPTGSTAYALSARGPIVDPAHQALILAPVAPHSLFDRSLVLTPDTRVGLVVEGDRPASVSIDGRILGPLVPGESVVATAAPTAAHLITFGDRNFHGILKAKFGLSDR